MSMRSPAPSLGKVEFLVLLWTTFAAFATLYGPQPLLPVIQQHFRVGSQSASLLMTLAILPLGLAPVCYGYILNLCGTRRLLQLTTALCALVLLAASFTTAFWQLGYRPALCPCLHLLPAGDLFQKDHAAAAR